MQSDSGSSLPIFEDALHTLAQPLTAISFAADMALLQDSPEVWRTALQTIQIETRRAVDALRVARTVATNLQDKGEN